MKIIIKNATLISMDDKRDKVEYDMDILIDDKNIVEISKNINMDVDKIIDASGMVVLPGMINTHAHVPMSIFRETIDGLKLQDWLQNKIWPMEAKLSDDDIYYASLLSFIEMIKTGTTTINDMYFKTDSIIKAKDIMGVRLQTTNFLMNQFNDGDTRINILKEILKKYKDHDDTLSFNVGLHGLYTSDLDYIKKCIELAKNLDIPLHMHFCENDAEVSDIIKLHNKKPIELLNENFNIHTVLAHAVKLSDDDIKKMANLNIHVSTCPISNLKLGCGIAKVSEMLNNSINVSIGTDGQGSGSSLDMFEAMKYTALLQKGINEDPTIINAYDVLKMATINGAKALKMDDKIGSITEGKKADLIIIDVKDVLLKPTNDLISEIVYNVKGSNVNTTIVDGKILMEDKVLKKDVDEYEIIDKCDLIIKNISRGEIV